MEPDMSKPPERASGARKTRPVTWRLPEDLLEDLRVRAQRDRRSVTVTVELLLGAGLLATNGQTITHVEGAGPLVFETNPVSVFMEPNPDPVDARKLAEKIVATTKTGERASGPRKHQWIDNATLGKMCAHCGARKSVDGDGPCRVDGNV